MPVKMTYHSMIRAGKSSSDSSSKAIYAYYIQENIRTITAQSMSSTDVVNMVYEMRIC